MHRVVGAALLLAGSVLCLYVSGWSDDKAGPPTLAAARKKYLGAKVNITGLVVPPSAGLLHNYANWRWAKKRADGRYEPETTADWGLLPFGSERRPATIVAIQLSSRQNTGPWVDILGNRHAAGELGPDFDFIVRFDDDRGGTALCTSSLATVASDFTVVGPKLAVPK
jgi:hypothetical protein